MVLVLVVGLAGFLYRGMLERVAGVPVATTTPSSLACTADAKICPDGSAVGRTGPNCSFALCAAPNAEIQTGSSTISFVLPAGYTQSEQAAVTPNTLRIYQKPTAAAGTNNMLTISAYPIATGNTARTVMLANTVFDPSGLQATSTNSFQTITAGNSTFYTIDIGRFEGQVETAYYLPTTATLYRFDLLEKNVQNWTDPNLNTATLPEHQAIRQMLSTVQILGS
jgi:hypothetical protein